MLESNLFYKDEYMQFSFKDIHSSKYNLYIKNDIDDLKIFINSETSIEYATPKYQNGKIVLGVTRPQRNIPLSLVAYGLCRHEILNMTKWMKAGEIGGLCFDFSKDWTYDTIISEMSDLNIYPLDNGYFIATFDITFSTLNGTAARNTLDATAYYGDGSNLTFDDISTPELGDTITVDNYNEINSQTAYNNMSLKIPSFEIESENNVHTLTLYYLGDGFINLNIDHSYETDTSAQSETSEETSSNKDICFEICCDSVTATLQNFTSKIELDSVIEETIGVLTYSQKENLFFIDHMLPEQQESRSIIENLKSNLSYQPLILKSPGAPVLIESEEHFNNLSATSLKWAVCSQAEFVTNAFATNPSQSLYPYSVNTPSGITKDTDIQNMGTEERELYLSTKSNYEGKYFVYYDEIIIKDTGNTKISEGEINITQYTEVI